MLLAIAGALFVALLPLSTLCQEGDQTILAKFTITDAKENGVDITPILLEAGAYTVFYTGTDEDVIYMANVWPNNDSQSYGPMYGVETEKIEESYDNYEADYFAFNWAYSNDYDGETGTARVEVIKVYKPQGVAFVLSMVAENLDVYVYKGFMEGTIDFSLYK